MEEQSRRNKMVIGIDQEEMIDGSAEVSITFTRPIRHLVLAICNERNRQDWKWGEQDHPDEWWLPILVEEIGEVAEAMLEVQFGAGGHDDVRKEVIEACAVALAWLECMVRRMEGE